MFQIENHSVKRNRILSSDKKEFDQLTFPFEDVSIFRTIFLNVPEEDYESISCLKLKQIFSLYETSIGEEANMNGIYIRLKSNQEYIISYSFNPFFMPRIHSQIERFLNGLDPTSRLDIYDCCTCKQGYPCMNVCQDCLSGGQKIAYCSLACQTVHNQKHHVEKTVTSS